MNHTITPAQWLRIRDEYNKAHVVCPVHGATCTTPYAHIANRLEGKR